MRTEKPTGMRKWGQIRLRRRLTTQRKSKDSSVYKSRAENESGLKTALYNWFVQPYQSEIAAQQERQGQNHTILT